MHFVLTSSFCNSQLSWEIIVVDDNSPDGTLEIAKQLAKVYGEDKIVCKPFIVFLSNCDSMLLVNQVLKPRAGKLGLG